MTRTPLVPLELLLKITAHLPYESIAELSSIREIQRLLKSDHFWRDRILKISTRSQLLCILRDPYSRRAKRLDLCGADLDDTDLVFIANHFQTIHHINLSHVSDLTDLGLASLLKLHGKHLQSLKLHKLFRLTNVTMENISTLCGPSLHCLDLHSTMISSTGLRELTEGGLMIRELILERCHIFDPSCLPALGEGLPTLRKISVAHIDAVHPYQLQALLQACPKLKTLDVSGCAEVTLKTIKQLQGTNQRLNIKHNAKLEDHSIDAVRRFLLGLVSVQ